MNPIKADKMATDKISAVKSNIDWTNTITAIAAAVVIVFLICCLFYETEQFKNPAWRVAPFDLLFKRSEGKEVVQGLSQQSIPYKHTCTYLADGKTLWMYRGRVIADIGALTDGSAEFADTLVVWALKFEDRVLGDGNFIFFMDNGVVKWTAKIIEEEEKR